MSLHALFFCVQFQLPSPIYWAPLASLLRRVEGLTGRAQRVRSQRGAHARVGIKDKGARALRQGGSACSVPGMGEAPLRRLCAALHPAWSVPLLSAPRPPPCLWQAQNQRLLTSLAQRDEDASKMLQQVPMAWDSSMPPWRVVNPEKGSQGG